MLVVFKRTGEHRYAVFVSGPGMPTSAADPAPGYDDNIPHDLVHYVVEAELRLTNGVYGRAARGAGTFIAQTERDISPRARARQQRKQRKRELGLRAQGGVPAAEMVESERLAGVCDLAWRRKAGQLPDKARVAPQLQAADTPNVERVVARLEKLAPLWRSLPVGGELAFEWPRLDPL